MKKYLSLLIVLLLSYVVTIAQKRQGLTIVIKSPLTPSVRLQEIVSIKWNDIVSKYPGIKSENFKVLGKDNIELPFQLEYKGLPVIQNLLVQVTISAGKVLKLKIVDGKPVTLTPKVFGRYVPERKDDFAWENDKVAFRMYGKALEATNENAYGIDVWAKRTDKLILNKWYKSGDYHADHGDGLDYYNVGFTLGAGDVAPYVEGKIAFPKNYRKWKILDQGPLRFSFQLEYDEWDVEGTLVKVTKQFSLDAGSQLNRVEATFSFSNGNGLLPVVVGIVKRKEKGTISSIVNNNGVLGYWEPEHGLDGVLGIGTIMLSPSNKSIETETHLLQETMSKNGEAVIYYTGAAWNKAGAISTAEEWFRYLNLYKSTINSPLEIKIN
ncbi:DUF4861 family protein [Pedobacter sp. JCM 36344]|uniref:DUF4861 family protein n=1 Tax=Pedobacter sp. JCM 36344 TaxID=3374280 RepID=UPI003978B0CF